MLAPWWHFCLLQRQSEKEEKLAIKFILWTQFNKFNRQSGRNSPSRSTKIRTHKRINFHLNRNDKCWPLSRHVPCIHLSQSPAHLNHMNEFSRISTPTRMCSRTSLCDIVGEFFKAFKTKFFSFLRPSKGSATDETLICNKFYWELSTKIFI